MSFQPISLSKKEKLDLKQLMKNSDDWQDNTDNIRKLKHSERIAKDVLSWMTIKASTSNQHECQKKAKIECSFLATHYPDIYHKLTTNVLDIAIFSQFIKYLQMIEEGNVDQAECSVMIGKLLKQIYIDSAIRHGETLDKQYSDTTTTTPECKRESKSISWLEYKAQHVSV